MFFDILSVLAIFSFDLSISAAISVGSNISFFSNSETCFTLLSSFTGFCFPLVFLILLYPYLGEELDLV